MADKQPVYTIGNVNGGIGSDKYLTVPGGVTDAEGVDLSKGKRVILSTNTTNNVVTFPNSSKVTTMGPTYYASDNGYIYSPSGETLYKYQSVSTADYDIRNYTTHTIGGTVYTLFFGRSKIMRYSAESNVSAVYSGTNWTDVSGVRTHTTGNTSVLTGTATVTTSSYYRVKLVVSGMTAGNITVSIGGATGQVVSTNGTHYLFFLASGTGNLTITPTSTFDGAINTNTSSIGRQNAVESYKDLTTSSNVCPVLTENGVVYVGNGKYLIGYNAIGDKISYFYLPEGEQINGLTKVGDQFVLWVDDGQGSKQYFWNGSSEAPERTIYWYNERIMNVVNQGSYHIVLTGNDFSIKNIWKSDGYNKIPLYQVPYTSFNITSNKLLPAIPLYYGGNSTLVYSNAIESLGQLVFMPAYGGILSYGKKTAGFPDAINLERKIDTDEIYAMYAYNDNLYVSYNVSGTCNVTQIKLENYENTLDTTDDYYFGKLGHVTYPPLVQLVSQTKTSKRMIVGYYLPTDDTFFNFYYNVDRDISYYTFVIDESINPVTIDPTVGAVYRTGTNARFTVTKVTKYNGFMFIETQETVKEFTPRTTTTLTRVSGAGDDTITYIKFHNFRHFALFSDTTKRTKAYDILSTFNEIQFRGELISSDGKYSPEINDFTLLYDPAKNG